MTIMRRSMRGADFPAGPEEPDSGFSYRTELLLMDKKEAAMRNADGSRDEKKGRGADDCPPDQGADRKRAGI